MTRAKLAEKLSLKMNVSKKEADKLILHILEGIMTNLKKDGRVVVHGFGSFHLRQYEARTGKKPLSEEEMEIPARNKPLFHASQELKELINNGAPSIQEEFVENLDIRQDYSGPGLSIESAP